MDSGTRYKSRKRPTLIGMFLGLLNIDVFKRHFSKCARIEIFFDKWFNTNDRGSKFSLFQPFLFNFCVYSVGRRFIF